MIAHTLASIPYAQLLNTATRAVIQVRRGEGGLSRCEPHARLLAHTTTGATGETSGT